MLKADYDLRIANRADKALKICETPGLIDLVLLDIMMPEMDGLEVCRRLRAQAATRELPILFITAKTETDDIVRGFAVGGNDYLTKPFRPEELLARVRTHLTLRAQRMQIARQNAELKEMLLIICHDLANHLGVLSLSLQLGEQPSGSGLTQFLPLMKTAVKHGLSLTEMVREMRRSEDKTVTLRAVPLAACLQESLLLMQARLHTKGAEFVLDVPPVEVLAEPCALTNSVLNNLLSNAIKFSPAGSQLQIRAAEAGEWVCLTIRDHGIGMPAEVLEHLFDLGRGHSRVGTDGERGTGFGMPLMRRFVTQFGGRVEVVSRTAEASPEHHGTEFKVWLQAAPKGSG